MERKPRPLTDEEIKLLAKLIWIAIALSEAPHLSLVVKALSKVFQQTVDETTVPTAVPEAFTREF